MKGTKERERIAKDPFHQQILDALGQHLDPQVFELCMTDLLRGVFPGLVPVPGGNDAGMDGAVAQTEGEPFPLVCTTGDDVHGNLAGSLGSFLKRGLSSRKVAVATSRTLTPSETRALFGLAKENGFTLLQVFERSAVASLLYHDTVWCKRLLGLTGQPSALSVFPPSRRPLVEIQLRGREDVVDWLRTTTGDRIVVGEPGSGKTYLFQSLIRSGWPALFLVSDDETAIANAIRDQKPRVVIVDDAHVAPERLVRLRRLREEIHSEFDIVAATWPGGRDDVREALGSPAESRILKLGLLTRNQILEIFHEFDVRPQDEILRDLVTQAANKPGLAVTIALLWKQGEWQKILDGTVLSRTLLTLFKGLTGARTSDVLAAFSLGGSRGMSLGAVSGFLGLPVVDVKGIAAGLAAGGVLSEVDGENLVVGPEILRSALLREVFFSGSALGHDYRKLLPLAPSLEKAVEEIVRTRVYGGMLPPDALHNLVLRSGSRWAWKVLALAGEEDARWVVMHYPGDLLDVAAELLQRVPDIAVPKILAQAAEMAGAGELRPDRPMSLLSSWARDVRLSLDGAIRRRRMLARASRDFLLAGGNRGTGVYGISIALSPAARGSSLDPGIGNTVNLVSGLLLAEGLRQLESIWNEVQSAIQEIDKESWGHLSSLLWDWLHPSYSAQGEAVSEEQEQAMRVFAERVLKDLASQAQESPGLIAELNRLAERIGLNLGLKHDPVYALLYPEPAPSIKDRREREVSQKAAIEKLALEWAGDPPKKTAARIAFYEREARRAGHTGLQNAAAFCRALAGFIEEPEVWLRALLSEDLRGHLVSPFLERVVELRRAGWEQEVGRALDLDVLAWSALSLIFTLPDPPSDLLNRALERAADFPMLIETLCLRNEVPLPTLRLLFSLSWEPALAAVVGEWCADPEGKVREEVLTEWRAAILRAKTADYEEVTETVGLQYWLGVILARDADLSLDWLRARLQEDGLPWGFMGDSPFAHAVRTLRREQRQELLRELQPISILRSLIPGLVEKDVDLYRNLLALPSLADYHLEPLEGLPDQDWEGLALAALEAGYELSRVAGATFESSYSFAGSGIEYWSRWDEAFAKLEDHSSEDLREVARYGRQEAQRQIQKAQEVQRRYELQGLGHG